ncbi:HesA/MoeB/ThiF family protein [Methanobrevibacter curvatus]|uniref:Putative adenylyltransferase/sulfurtransferase MoeZ n=1 Tax=Methanobrevibacter curvatus TaxID=49547 RepID=A0A166CTN7_9EURY|nr:HesA/MoeB/ThiF family protein [Methanobrevibacter curvatus]KZX14853.1 putative adenylyltransferase/sulfurtransferase MoeZ [Methanobrevibacter curvatus]
MPTRYIGDGYWEIISRQMGIVTRSEQERYKDAKVTVIGAGGIGGTLIEMLARMGVGSLTLIDKDAYDLSNLNRQLVATLDTLGKVKSVSAKERVRTINPYVKVNVYNEALVEDNVEKVIEGSDVVVDGLDNLLTRVIVSRKARELEIPYVHGAIYGTLGQVSVFTPDTPSYEELFKLPTKDRALNEDALNDLSKVTSGVPPVIGPVPNIIGNVEAFEAFKIITGIGKVTYAPKIFKYNLLDLASFGVDEL